MQDLKTAGLALSESIITPVKVLLPNRSLQIGRDEMRGDEAG